MESIQQFKACVHCNVEKPLNEFPVNGGTKDKHSTICKECTRAYCKQWREKKKLGISTSRPVLTPEERYHRRKDTTRKYRETHREKLQISGMEYYAKNKEHFREYRRTARQDVEYKKRQAVIQNRRRARKRGNGGNLTVEEWNIVCEKYGNKCLACGRTDMKLTMDHVIPLAFGGKHSMDNIQPLCHSCNCKKNAKTIDYRERGR